MHPLYEKQPTQNVEGLERAASLAGGLFFLSRGIRGRGLGGVLQLAIGGMALARGVTGQCQLKRKLDEYQSQQAEGEHNKQQGQHGIERYSHMPMESETISTDFAGEDDQAPNSRPMGHETHVEAGAEKRG